MSQSTTTEEAPLVVQDITDAISAIDYACEQGAYKGWTNIVPVLSVRTRLKAFVDRIEAATKTASEGQPSPDVVAPSGLPPESPAEFFSSKGTQ